MKVNSTTEYLTKTEICAALRVGATALNRVVDSSAVRWRMSYGGHGDGARGRKVYAVVDAENALRARN